MNKELEATLIHVLRMPEDWQKKAARAMLPTLYKWETRNSMPQLSDAEFDRQWRAVHDAKATWRTMRAFDRIKLLVQPMVVKTRQARRRAVAVAQTLAGRAFATRKRFQTRITTEDPREVC